ncbi:MAG: ArsR/SmtB family transcription factor [Burkholderiales bacterium]
MGAMDDVFESVADYMKLLAVPTRLKVLHSICDGEKSVGEIVGECALTQTNVSRQLRTLYAAGVLSRRQERNLVYYQLSDPTLLELCHVVCGRIAVRIDARKPLKKSLLKFMGTHRRGASS